MGVGVAVNAAENACFIVTRFWPRGNILGEYRENVSQGSARVSPHILLLGSLIVLLHEFDLDLFR